MSNLSKAVMIGAASLAVGCAAPRTESNLVGDYLSARAAAQSHDIENAAAAFSKVENAPLATADIRRAAFYYRLAAGDYAEALVLARALAKNPETDEGGFARAVLAAQAIKGGDYSEAERLIAAAQGAGFPAPAAKLFTVWAVAGREGEVAALEKLRNIPGDEFLGFYPLHAALLSENLGEVEDARSAYQISVMAFSGAAEVAAYGAFLERSGDEATVRDFYHLLAEQEGTGRFAGRAGLARLESGKLLRTPAYRTPEQGAAIAIFSLASGVLQDTFRRRNAAIEAGFRVGDADYNIPLAMAQLALFLDPQFHEARRLAGSIFNAYDRHDEAIRILSMVPSKSASYEQARIEIASAYQQKGQSRRAIKTLRSAVNAIPDARDAKLMLAGVYAEEARYRDAIDVLDGLIAGLPADPPPSAWRAYLSRATNYLEVDDWPNAEADLERAVEVAPNESVALNYLGYSWAERGENLDEAFELIERAVSLDPSSGAIIDSLGWAHFQLGRYEEAVGHLEQAASLEPADPTITDHLGDVYWRLDRPLEARYQWRRVLELEPNDVLAHAVRAKIKDGLPDYSEEQ